MAAPRKGAIYLQHDGTSGPAVRYNWGVSFSQMDARVRGACGDDAVLFFCDENQRECVIEDEHSLRDAEQWAVENLEPLILDIKVRSTCLKRQSFHPYPSLPAQLALVSPTPAASISPPRLPPVPSGLVMTSHIATGLVLHDARFSVQAPPGLVSPAASFSPPGLPPVPSGLVFSVPEPAVQVSSSSAASSSLSVPIAVGVSSSETKVDDAAPSSKKRKASQLTEAHGLRLFGKQVLRALQKKQLNKKLEFFAFVLQQGGVVDFNTPHAQITGTASRYYSNHHSGWWSNSAGWLYTLTKRVLQIRPEIIAAISAESLQALMDLLPRGHHFS